MLRHVAMFRFTPESTAEQHEAAFESLRTLPGIIPQIRDYKIGTDLGLVEGNWQAVVVADFDDEDDWRTYSQDSTHLQIIADRMKPIVAERAGVQYLI
jgi:hypothetical protein